MANSATAEHDERRENLRRALAEDPANSILLIELGRLEFEAWRPRDAQAAFRRAVDLDPNAESLEWLGASLNRQERFREALPFLRQAVDLEPGRASAWNSAGEALGNLGRLEEAGHAFTQAVRWRPDFAHAHYNMGLVLRAMDRDQAAAVLSMLPADEISDMCLQCHEKGERKHWKGSAHDGRGVSCISCHQIHHEGEAPDALLSGGSVSATCRDCHLQKAASMVRSAHMPVREGSMSIQQTQLFASLIYRQEWWLILARKRASIRTRQRRCVF